MKSISEIIHSFKNELEKDITEFLVQNSELRNIMQKSGIVFIGPSYSWSELSLEASRLRSKLLVEYKHFEMLVQSILQGQPDEICKEVKKQSKNICECIEQTHCVWYSSILEAKEAVFEGLSCMVDTVDKLHDSMEGATLIVPDTNILLEYPNIDHWEFDNIPKFSIILVPSVLKELDILKVYHKNQQVQEKAKKLIHQLQEYRRRGSLNKGVVIVKERIILQSFAVEPKVCQTLPWLDQNNEDDRLIATVIELMRQHPRSKVAIISLDINLQNKIDFARLPLLDAPIYS